MTAHVFGATVILFCLLAVMSIIDIWQMRIPNMLNLLLLGSGVFFWLLFDRSKLWNQAMVASGTALAFYLIRQLHFRTTGRIGLGLGDVKMAGAGAIWIAPVMLPAFLFLASFGGLTAVLLKMMLGGPGALSERLPFAPFLALGLAGAWVMGW